MNRARVRVMTVALVVAIAFGAGVGVGTRLGPAPVAGTAASSERYAGFGLFWEAWDLVKEHFVQPERADPTAMTHGAIAGMLDSLGDTGHTRFLDPEERRRWDEQLSGNFVGIGVQTATGINLTTAWSIHAALEHFWRPDLKSSLWVNYVALDYGAVANAQLANGVSNNDFAVWVIGSRTQWDVSKQLSLGAEVSYGFINSAKCINGNACMNYTAAGAGVPASNWFLNDQSEWSFRFRAQYNFLP